MLELVERMHGKHLLHRDIKPDNFLMGMGDNSSQVYMIDFGLAKRYHDTTTKRHIRFVANKSLTGTARYASLNAHLGYELSRRDDLISLGYVMIYFLSGSLPWQVVTVSSKSNNFRQILKLKEEVDLGELCKDCPLEFILYMKHCTQLNFSQEPDYGYLKMLIQSVADREGVDLEDKTFDWNCKLA